MAVSFYMDVHVPQAIADQLRDRNVDVVTAIEDGAQRLPDDDLLERAASMGRIMFTQDIRFRAMALAWQQGGRPFAGLVYGHQIHGSIGQYVKDLELIAKASESAEWENVVDYLHY